MKIHYRRGASTREDGATSDVLSDHGTQVFWEVHVWSQGGMGTAVRRDGNGCVFDGTD
jgi:acyl-coenzyme A thioesterase PaaI-like protein